MTSTYTFMSTLVKVLKVDRLPAAVEKKLLEEKITRENFVLLDDRDLKDLGFPLGQRKELRQWIEKQSQPRSVSKQPARHGRFTEPVLRAAFDSFDKDGNGSISPTELHEVMNELGTRMSRAESRRLFKTADINGDGKINFTEFVIMMKGY